MNKKVVQMPVAFEIKIAVGPSELPMTPMANASLMMVLYLCCIYMKKDHCATTEIPQIIATAKNILSTTFIIYPSII